MSLQEIFRELFQAASPRELDTGRLNSLQQQYPWFETLHVVSALHNAATGETTPHSFSQAALVTGNELWLQVLLDDASQMSAAANQPGAITNTGAASETEPELLQTVEQKAADTGHRQELTEAAPQTAIETVSANQPEPTTPAFATATAFSNENETGTTVHAGAPVTDSEAVQTGQPATEQASDVEAVIAAPVSEAVHETAPVKTDLSTENQLVDQIAAKAVMPPAEQTGDVEVVMAAHGSETVHETAPVETDLSIENQPVDQTAAEAVMPSAQPLVETPEPAAVAAGSSGTQQAVPEIPIDPWHTIDYFAAVGVKEAPDDKPKDRLGRQLKSFTGWLKSLKKLPGGKPAEDISEAENQKVEQLATNSVKKPEVLTETMAEVLAGQGRVDEAIDILKKLSLQDSSKSAYFAALIAHLKLK